MSLTLLSLLFTFACLEDFRGEISSSFIFSWFLISSKLQPPLGSQLERITLSVCPILSTYFLGLQGFIIKIHYDSKRDIYLSVVSTEHTVQKQSLIIKERKRKTGERKKKELSHTRKTWYGLFREGRGYVATIVCCLRHHIKHVTFKKSITAYFIHPFVHNAKISK